MLISVAIAARRPGGDRVPRRSIRSAATFLNSAQFLSNNGKWPVPASPFVNLFIGIAAPHTWLAVLLGVATVAGVVAIAVPTYLMGTRNMLAYSFDRVLPTKLSEVNDRTHTPIYAILFVMLLMLGFLAGFVYSSSSFVVYLGISGIVVFGTFAIVGICGGGVPVPPQGDVRRLADPQEQSSVACRPSRSWARSTRALMRCT